MVSTFATQFCLLGSNLGQDVSVRNLYVSVSGWVFSGYSGFLPHSKNMQSWVRLIGHSKLPAGVSVDGCFTLYVSHVIN